MNTPVMDPLRWEDFIYICMDVPAPEYYITIGQIEKQENYWFGWIRYNKSSCFADGKTEYETFDKLLDLFYF